MVQLHQEEAKHEGLNFIEETFVATWIQLSNKEHEKDLNNHKGNSIYKLFLKRKYLYMCRGFKNTVMLLIILIPTCMCWRDIDEWDSDSSSKQPLMNAANIVQEKATEQKT